MELDRLHRHEERLRDLLVREVACGQLGDAALARRQSVEARPKRLARPRSQRSQLLVGTLDEREHAAPEREVGRGAKPLARNGAPPGAPLSGAEVEQSARLLQPGAGACEHLDGLGEQAFALLAADDAPQRAKRRADLVASAPAPRDLELLLGQPAGLLVAAEEQQAVDREAPPGIRRRVVGRDLVAAGPTVRRSSTPRSTSRVSIRSRPRAIWKKLITIREGNSSGKPGAAIVSDAPSTSPRSSCARASRPVA